ncbi:MAG: chloride channel protein [Acidimicrobiales bacterium]
MAAIPERSPHEAHHAWGGSWRTWAARLVLGAVVGVLAGLSSAVFLETLAWATRTREANPWLIPLLPLCGLAIGAAYHYVGKDAAAGNNLVLDEIHEPSAWVPRRMAAMVLVGTIGTHLFGGSAGREGTAIQMAGSLTDGLDRLLHITGRERRILLLAAIGGGFSAVFGVPFAGFAFALEVQAVGRLRWTAAPVVAVAAVVGNAVVRALHVHHTPYPVVRIGSLDAALVGKVALAGVAFGLAAAAFAEATHRTKHLMARHLAWPPLRPVLGGIAVVALTLAVGDHSFADQTYNGLSIPLLEAALAGGVGVAAGAFALKGLFTVITLGTGFQGGEVTPLFVIGATLGVTLGRVLDVPVPLMAALGFVAVFAGATKTPIACTVMGIELFGWEPAALFALACTVAFLASGTRGIYTAQRRRSWGFRHQPDEVADLAAAAATTNADVDGPTDDERGGAT